MKHLSFLTGIVLLAFSLSVSAKENPPNILLIIGDDCTYTDLPINGGENAKTPHIDSLSKRTSNSTTPSSSSFPTTAPVHTTEENLFPMSNQQTAPLSSVIRPVGPGLAMLLFASTNKTNSKAASALLAFSTGPPD